MAEVTLARPGWADPEVMAEWAWWDGRRCTVCGLPVVRSGIQSGPGREVTVHAVRTGVLVPHNVDESAAEIEVREAFAELRALEDRRDLLRRLGGSGG